MSHFSVCIVHFLWHLSYARQTKNESHVLHDIRQELLHCHRHQTLLQIFSFPGRILQCSRRETLNFLHSSCFDATLLWRCWWSLTGIQNILQSNTPTVLIILKKNARLPLENYKNTTRIIIRVASLQNWKNRWQIYKCPHPLKKKLVPSYKQRLQQYNLVGSWTKILVHVISNVWTLTRSIKYRLTIKPIP